MNPQLMQKLMPLLAGAGLEKFASSLKKIQEAMAGLGQMGPPRQAPSALQKMMAARATPAPPSPAAGGPSPDGAPPPNLAMLAQLMQNRPSA